MTRLTLIVALIAAAPALAAAQEVDGYVAAMADVLPNEDASELRLRLFAEHRADAGEHIRVTAAAFVEGLLARRHSSAVSDALIRPQELHVEFAWPQADLRVGLSRIVWGRLDEFQPTDVVNPLDLTRFFFEGRNEGRLPVALLRARLLPSENFTFEAVYVPFFRRGRFDQVDESTSPFNLVRDVPVVAVEPARTARNGQGGVRASFTTGRVDWAVSAYRGIETFPAYELHDFLATERFDRFTMIGGDFETVRGVWGLRGELAGRDDGVEGGVGVDRRAGAYRISGNVVAAVRDDEDADVTLVTAIDRSFARETRQLRILGVYNPIDQSAFARLILAFNLRDNVSLETSGGVFAGDGADAIGRLRTRDFAYARLKVFF
jgi:hypothetical protein